MAAKKTEAQKPTQKAVEVKLPQELWVAATGSEDPGVHLARVKEIAYSVWLPDGISEEEQNERIQAAIKMFAEIKPQNGLEGMLATQMVATHSAAIECLRRAMVPGQSFEGRDQNLKHSNKLLQTFARQIEILDKHRGKGQQKITVEHVTVEAGGQAIVGNVTAAPAAQPAQESAAPMLAHQPAEFMPLIKDITPAKAPTQSRRTGPGPTDPE